MSNAPMFMCYGTSQIVVLITKHINMNKSIYDKIAHQQLKLPLLIVKKNHKGTKKTFRQEHRFKKLELSYS